MTKLSLYQECEVGLISEKSTDVIHHTKKIKKQIINKYTKVLDKSQCPFTIKVLSKLRLGKRQIKKASANIIMMKK